MVPCKRISSESPFLPSTFTCVARNTPATDTPRASTRAPSTRPAVPSGNVALLASTGRPSMLNSALDVTDVTEPRSRVESASGTSRSAAPKASTTQRPATGAALARTRWNWSLASPAGTSPARRPA